MYKFILMTLLFILPFITCSAQTPLDVNHVQIAEKVIRVGRNIAYYDETGVLKVARPEFVKEGNLFKCETTKQKVYLSFSPANEPWPLQVKYAGKILKFRPDSLGYYNSQTDTFRKIHLPQYSSPVHDFPGYVYFKDIFPDINLGNLAVRSAMNFIFRIYKTDNIPSPENGEDYLGVAIEMDLSSLGDYRLYISRGGGVKDYYIGSNTNGLNVSPEHIRSTLISGDSTRSRRLPLCLPDNNGNYTRYFLLDDMKIFDNRLNKEIEDMSIHLVNIAKRINGKDYLLSLIPVSWLNNEARFPVLLVPSIATGLYSNPVEVFQPGYTYIVGMTYKVRSLTSLGTPDQPVYVKLLPYYASRISITKKGDSGAGAKVGHTIFTSIYDTNPNHGAVVNPSLFGLEPRDPAPGDYGRALDAVKGGDSYIRNSRFYYAERGITCYTGVNPDKVYEITNVLIDKCSDIGAHLTQWGNFSKNTVRRCGKGIQVTLPDFGQVFNCVFAENQTRGANKLPSGASGSVWYDNGQHVEEGSLGGNSISEANGLTDPFTSGTYGDSYLRNDLTDKDGNPTDLSNKGFKYPNELNNQ